MAHSLQMDFEGTPIKFQAHLVRAVPCYGPWGALLMPLGCGSVDLNRLFSSLMRGGQEGLLYQKGLYQPLPDMYPRMRHVSYRNPDNNGSTHSLPFSLPPIALRRLKMRLWQFSRPFIIEPPLYLGRVPAIVCDDNRSDPPSVIE